MINTDNVQNSKFYNYIVIKLNNNNLDKSDLIGLISIIIYSKDLFPHNKDIKSFIDSIFNQSFPNYIIKSRTLIVAKSARIMYDMSLEEADEIHIKMIDYFNVKSTSSGVTNKNSKKSYDKLNTWMNKL